MAIKLNTEIPLPIAKRREQACLLPSSVLAAKQCGRVLRYGLNGVANAQ